MGFLNALFLFSDGNSGFFVPLLDNLALFLGTVVVTVYTAIGRPTSELVSGLTPRKHSRRDRRVERTL